jgi:tetratricopeptide (TPR) repeat protein
VERLLPLALARPTEALAQADELLARQPDAYDASIAHQARGIVLRDRGRPDEAVTALRAALRSARRSGQPDRLLDVQATLGLTVGLAGRTRAGLAMLDEAVAGSTGVVGGRVLMRRAYLRRALGQHAEALIDLRRAIALLSRGGDTVWEARSRSLRFLVYVALGQMGRADRDLAVAERLLAAAGQDLESAMAVHSRADLAFQSGDLPAALRLLDQAAARYDALSVPVPDLAIDRCGVLLAAGLATEAMAVSDEAIRRYPPGSGSSSKRAELLFAAARAAQAAGVPAVAIVRAAAARALFQIQRRPWWQARAAYVLVQSRYQNGERGGRLRAELGRIAARLDEVGADEAAAAHLLAGRLALDQGRRPAADRHLAASERLRHRGPPFGRPAGWLAHALRAEVRHDTRRTLIACRRGLEVATEYQRTLGATELRALAAAYGTELAAIAQRHALRRGDPRMLLAWTERWRAGALAAPPARPADAPGLAADLTALRGVLSRLDRAGPDGGGLGRADRARLEQDRRRLEASIRSRARQTAAHRGAPGVPRHGTTRRYVDEILDRLDGYRLIELVILDGTLYAVTAAGRRVRLHTVGPAADAAREVELARFLLRRLAYGRPSADAAATLAAVGRRLEETLLGPAATELDGRPVVLVPPGRLHAVPWALLPSLSTTPVHVAPSTMVWLRALAARPPHNRRLALVVGPGLPGTAAEVTKIGDGYPDPVILCAGSAVADRVLAALDGAWTAHVAAHGVFHAENALFSALHLDDGPLTVYDLSRLRRAPFRLVLSSCESALGAHVAGDELLGMVSALVPLGTASLLASVVAVNDAATAPFMVSFHNCLRTADSFADALVATRREVGADPVATATAVSFVALGR